MTRQFSVLSEVGLIRCGTGRKLEVAQWGKNSKDLVKWCRFVRMNATSMAVTN